MRSLFTFLCLLPVVFCQHQLHAQYITTFAGNGYGASTGTGGYTGNGGLANAAELNACTDVCFDGAGNIYIADRNNNVVRKVNTSGIISTFAGKDTAGYSGDNGPATLAKLNQPYGVAADAAGNVYVSDYNNSVIRKINTSGIISTYAGNGVAGYSGNGSQATTAQLYYPMGLAVDTTGNLFIADAGNNMIREVFTSGIILTVAGTGTASYSGDGTLANGATLSYPVAVAVDPYNQLYIADFNNNVVRKVDTLNIISTFAGNGTIGLSGDGGLATHANLHAPAGVSVYGFGNVYISDEGNNTIRMVNSSGIITSFAGSFTNGYTGDGGYANVAQLSSPKGIAADGQNRLFIADFDNNVIRLVSTITATPNITTGEGEMKIYPNPSNGSFTMQLPGTGSESTITITDVLGRVVETKNTASSLAVQTLNISNIPTGSYIVKVNSGNNIYRQQVQVW